MASASTAVTVPSARTADVRGPVPWVLVALTGVAVILIAKSLLSDWLSSEVYVRPQLDESAHEGFGWFGARGTGFAIGLGVLLVLVGLALWRTGRTRTYLALGGVVLTVLLLVDALLMVLRIGQLRAAAAVTVVDLVRDLNEREQVPDAYGFLITAQGLYVGACAALLLGLVAVQLVAPRHGPWIQAVTGTVFGAIAVSLPWVQSWTMYEYRLRTDSVGLFSLGLEGLLLVVELVALVVLTYLTLRAPGYARARTAMAASALSVLIFLSAIMAETGAVQQLHDLGTASDIQVLDAQSTGVVGVMVAAAVLLGLAALRSYWRGREELPPDESGSWLPGSLRERRD